MTDRPSVSKRDRATKPTRRTRDTRKRVTKASAPLVIKSVEQAAAEEAAAAEYAAVAGAGLAGAEAAQVTAPLPPVRLGEELPDEYGFGAFEEAAAKADARWAGLEALPEIAPAAASRAPLNLPEVGEAPEAPEASEAAEASEAEPSQEPAAAEPEKPADVAGVAEAVEAAKPAESAEPSEAEPAEAAEPTPEDRGGVPVYRAPSAEELADADIEAWSTTTPEAERQQLLAEQAAAEARRARMAGAVFKAILAFIVVMAVVFTGLLSWERWYHHDDLADFQGTWRVQGEAGIGHPDVDIRITDTKIILDINTTYGYTLDTSKKTITYTFQNLSGEGHYRFSADRRYLLITDGHYTWLETCISDFIWQLESWRANFYGTAQPDLGDLEGATLLYREY